MSQWLCSSDSDERFQCETHRMCENFESRLIYIISRVNLSRNTFKRLTSHRCSVCMRVKTRALDKVEIVVLLGFVLVASSRRQFYETARYSWCERTSIVPCWRRSGYWFKFLENGSVKHDWSGGIDWIVIYQYIVAYIHNYAIPCITYTPVTLDLRRISHWWGMSKL